MQRDEGVIPVDYFQAVRARHSVRAYQAQPVEPEKLLAILEAASHAPSAGNLQAYEIYLITQPARLEALARAAHHQGCIAQAPLALVFCAHPARSARQYGQRGRSLYSLQDATIAATFALLAATALDLATTWVGAFDDAGVQQVIGAPKGHLPIVILPVGYPAETPEPTSRRPLGELVHET